MASQTRQNVEKGATEGGVLTYLHNVDDAKKIVGREFKDRSGKPIPIEFFKDGKFQPGEAALTPESSITRVKIGDQYFTRIHREHDVDEKDKMKGTGFKALAWMRTDKDGKALGDVTVCYGGFTGDTEKLEKLADNANCAETADERSVATTLKGIKPGQVPEMNPQALKVKDFTAKVKEEAAKANGGAPVVFHHYGHSNGGSLAALSRVHLGGDAVCIEPLRGAEQVRLMTGKHAADLGLPAGINDDTLKQDTSTIFWAVNRKREKLVSDIMGVGIGHVYVTDVKNVKNQAGVTQDQMKFKDRLAFNHSSVTISAAASSGGVDTEVGDASAPPTAGAPAPATQPGAAPSPEEAPAPKKKEKIDDNIMDIMGSLFGGGGIMSLLAMVMEMVMNKKETKEKPAADPALGAQLPPPQTPALPPRPQNAGPEVPRR